MYKVMIVDDETWIRKGIKAQIEWERLGLVPGPEAADGLEALAAAESDMPDILITDVRMPGLDGLELAERLAAKRPGLKVLIVSGYGEFEYAKAAIKLQAVSYILKPIHPAELNDMLEKAAAKLKEESIGKRLAEHLPGSLEKHAADLCLGTAVPATEASFLDALQLRGLTGRRVACVLFHYDDALYDAESMSALLERTFRSLPSGDERFFLWERTGSRLSAIATADDGASLRSFVDYGLLGLRKANVDGVWAAAGEPVELSEVRSLARSYREALAMSERHGLRRNGSFFPFCENGDDALPFAYPLHLQKKVNEALLRNDKAGYKAAALEIDDFFRNTEGATLRHARGFFLSVVSDAVRSVLAQPSFHEAVVNKGFDFCLHIESYEDLQRMTEWLDRYLQEIGAALDGAAQRDVHRNVLAAADYIREHYAEDISLHSVSTRYYVTSTYFSSMFKEIVGENFLEFLTRIRMEKARELLAASDLKVGLIGEKVGYADSRYFSKLFKKHTGLMPTEYRQLHSNADAVRDA